MMFDIDSERCAWVDWGCVTWQAPEACIGNCDTVSYTSTLKGTKNMLKFLASTQMLGVIYNGSPSQMMYLQMMINFSRIMYLAQRHLLI